VAPSCAQPSDKMSAISRRMQVPARSLAEVAAIESFFLSLDRDRYKRRAMQSGPSRGFINTEH
jgi:hypothetical protein